MELFELDFHGITALMRAMDALGDFALVPESCHLVGAFENARVGDQWVTDFIAGARADAPGRELPSSLPLIVANLDGGVASFTTPQSQVEVTKDDWTAMFVPAHDCDPFDENTTQFGVRLQMNREGYSFACLMPEKLGIGLSLEMTDHAATYVRWLFAVCDTINKNQNRYWIKFQIEDKEVTFGEWWQSIVEIVTVAVDRIYQRGTVEHPMHNPGRDWAYTMRGWNHDADQFLAVNYR